MPANPQKARELFLHAVGKLRPEHWEGYVAEACGDDTELAEEVRRLLNVHRDAGSFLDRPAAAIGATGAFTLEPGAGVAGFSLQENAGTVIGPYKLLQQIGAGGMGVVWMAEQTQPVQRKVALKVIKPGMDTHQVIARFEAERQALAMMDHVNIARVLDAGTTESGLPYFVMELVHGVPITKYCDDNHLAPRERLELFVPVCQAIQHAHQKGIIHRDIKPSNVMITHYDGKPVPKVIDFGVAKATEQKLTERTLFTQYGTMVGTLEYMSPEQAETSALGVDTRSDIYSLGVLLYELLTGSTPLSQKRLNEAAYAEILRMIKEEEPPKPSTRLSDSGEALASISAQRDMEPAKLTKLVRGELDWIVMKTLEKDRNRRYETVNAFAADVQRYLNDEQVLACPPSAWYRLKKFVRRNKVAVGVGGVIAASLALTFGSLLFANDALAAKAEETLRAKERTDEALGERTKALAEKTTALTEKSTALMDLNWAHVTLERKAYQQAITLGELRWLNGDVARAENELGNCPLSLRGWEWHYLKRLCRTELQVFKQGNPISGVHVSPDGQRLAARGKSSPVLDPADKGARYWTEIKIWDMQAGGLLFRLASTQSNVLGLEASPNCLWVASVHAKNGTVDVWDVRSGKKAWTVRGTHPGFGPMSQALFSPEGEHLATRTDEHEVLLWDLKTGKLVRTLSVQGAGLGGWAFSHNGRQLAIAVYQKAVKNGGEAGDAVHIWDVGSGNKLFTLAGGTMLPSFSPDGRRLAAAASNERRTARIWDLTRPGGPVLHSLQLEDPRIESLIFSSDGQWIATQTYSTKPGTFGRGLTVWSVKSGLALYSLRARMGNMLGNLRVSADGKRLAATEGALVRIWQGATGQELLTLRGHRNEINTIEFLADGRLASAGDNEIRIWDTANPQEALLVHHTDEAFSVVLSPDGRLGASASHKEIKVWEAATGKEITSRSVFPREPNRIHFSPDSTRVAAIEVIRGTPPKLPVKVWEATTGKELFTLEGTRVNRHLAFSPNGKYIATAGGEEGEPSGVFIWDALTGKEMKVLLGHDTDINGLAFNSDSTLVAASSAGELNMPRKPCEVKVWDLATGKEVFSRQVVRGRSKGRVLFSPDGRRLAWAGGTGSKGELKVWDLAQGEELLTRNLQSTWLGSVAFSPNSKLITSAEPDRPGRTVFLWDIATGKEAVRLVGEGGQVHSLAFSPNGERIAIATVLGDVKLWDAATGQEMLVLSGDGTGMVDLTFSPDGHRIATAGSWKVRIWDATPRK